LFPHSHDCFLQLRIQQVVKDALLQSKQYFISDRNLDQFYNLDFFHRLLLPINFIKVRRGQKEQLLVLNLYRWLLGKFQLFQLIFKEFRRITLYQEEPKILYVKKYLDYFWKALILLYLPQSSSHQFLRKLQTFNFLPNLSWKKLCLSILNSSLPKPSVNLCGQLPFQVRDQLSHQNLYQALLLFINLKI
jgi:hypothetical protein